MPTDGSDEDAASSERPMISERAEAGHERPAISERTFPETLRFNLRALDVTWIIIPDGSPRYDDDEVRALAKSYRITGVRIPLAVRELAPRTQDTDPVFKLLSDPARLEALKRLGITCADCWVIKGDEGDERLYRLASSSTSPK